MSQAAHSPGTGAGGLRGFRWLALATAVATYLLIVLGAFTRVSGSGLGCGNDWPLCHGQLLPPFDFEPIVEWTHRFVAAVIGFLIVGTALGAWVAYRRRPLVLWPATLAVLLLLVQILLGAVTVKLDLPRPVVATHMANSLLILAASTIVAGVLLVPRFRGGRGAEERAPRSFARLAFWSAVLGYVVLVTGALVRASAAELVCAGWPLCGSSPASAPRSLVELHMGHRYMTGLLGLLMLATVVVGWRHRAAMPKLARHTLGIGLLLLAQVIGGGLMVFSGLDAFWRGFHVAVATAVWAGFVMLALMANTRTALETAPAADSREGPSPGRLGRRPAADPTL